MKLSLLNPWKSLGQMYSKHLEYQTSKVTQNTYQTFIRDGKTKKLVTKTVGATPESSLKNAVALLQRVGGEAVWDAIENEHPIVQSETKFDERQRGTPRQGIEWRDGTGHSHKAQRRIVGEAVKPKKVKFRDPVAKNLNKFNKPATHKDKKNDYKRRSKYGLIPMADTCDASPSE